MALIFKTYTATQAYEDFCLDVAGDCRIAFYKDTLVVKYFDEGDCGYVIEMIRDGNPLERLVVNDGARAELIGIALLKTARFT